MFVKVKSLNLKTQTVLLQKTQIVDVYEVFTLDKKCRFGIAFVPTIKISHYLRQNFLSNDQLIIDCVFNGQNSKWAPIIE